MNEANNGHEVLWELRGHVGLITLNRPHRLNAMDMGLAHGLHAALDALEQDRRTRVVVMAGAGERAFSVGADLTARAAMTEEEKWVHGVTLARAFQRMESYPVPVIAAIHGFCLGGGCELALACDVRVAESTASFGLPEVKLGIFPGAGGAVRILRMLLPGKARELLYTGRQITGAEAHRIGLVESLGEPAAGAAPGTGALATALGLADEIAGNGPLGVRALKRLTAAVLSADNAAALALSDALRQPLNATRDYAEALAAFAERRRPEFRGE